MQALLQSTSRGDQSHEHYITSRTALSLIALSGMQELEQKGQLARQAYLRESASFLERLKVRVADRGGSRLPGWVQQQQQPLALDLMVYSNEVVVTASEVARSPAGANHQEVAC